MIIRIISQCGVSRGMTGDEWPLGEEAVLMIYLLIYTKFVHNLINTFGLP